MSHPSRDDRATERALREQQAVRARLRAGNEDALRRALRRDPELADSHFARVYRVCHKRVAEVRAELGLLEWRRQA